MVGRLIFLPSSFVAVFESGIRGSEIRDPRWIKIGIRDKHPGSATLIAIHHNVLEDWSRPGLGHPTLFHPLAAWQFGRNIVQYLGSNIVSSDPAFEFTKAVVAPAYWLPRFSISWPAKNLPCTQCTPTERCKKFINKSKTFLYFFHQFEQDLNLMSSETKSAQLSVPTCLSCPARQWWREAVAFQPPKTTARGAGAAVGRRRRLRPVPWRAAGPPGCRDWGAAPTRSLAPRSPPRWCSHCSPDAHAGQTLINRWELLLDKVTFKRIYFFCRLTMLIKS